MLRTSGFSPAAPPRTKVQFGSQTPLERDTAFVKTLLAEIAPNARIAPIVSPHSDAHPDGLFLMVSVDPGTVDATKGLLRQSPAMRVERGQDLVLNIDGHPRPVRVVESGHQGRGIWDADRSMPIFPR